MKRLRFLFALMLAALLLPIAAWGATPGASVTTDPSTIASWESLLRNTTQNVGRIWTDKSVSSSDVTLPGHDLTIEKGNADFITSLSALSSTSNLKSTSTEPLDIVLVLDASGSMDDPMGGRGQGTRIEALRTAANTFIDSIAKENASISDPARQHAVSIVKYAGKKTSQIGNDTYWSRNNLYNYTQVMKNLGPCTTDTAASYQASINDIRPNGCTRADYAMDLAQSQLNGVTRTSKKVVIFFTDGMPTSSNGFEPDVANNTVTMAKDLKDAGATIYSVGIFSGASPSASVVGAGRTDTERANRFMHAISSNYPNASKYNDLGTAGEQGGFYKAATSADELDEIFADISQEITTSAGFPTETTDGYEQRSGYITFDDQLGDYLQVDDFSCIVFDNVVYDSPAKSEDGNVTTYTFSGNVHAGKVSGQLSDIIITVTHGSAAREGDRVQVKLPATLIPLRAFNVEADGTGSVDDIYPVRFFYTSSLKAEALDLLANPDADMLDYLKSHVDERGRVYFLANSWSGGANGDASATFTPAAGNSYYHIDRDTPIYLDEACTRRASYPLVEGLTYHYQRTWYEITDAGQAVERQTVVSFDSSAVENLNGYVSSDAGKAYFKAGTTRMTYITELHAEKGNNNNATSTAANALNPLWVGASVRSSLGNNGKLTLEQPSTLAVSKTVEVADGLDTSHYEAQSFEFKIEVPAAAGKSLKAEVQDASGEVVSSDDFVVTFDDDGVATHSLKHGETLRVFGLDGNATYVVSELGVIENGAVTPAGELGYETTAAGEQGTMTAGQTAEAAFTNSYATSSVTLEGETSLAGTKQVDGRDWLASDSFSFVIVPVGTAPLPQVDGTTQDVAVVSGEGTNPRAFHFGDITYTTPGTYVYDVYELKPGERGQEEVAAGMSVSQALWRVTVTVSDNHDGTLATSVMTEQLKDDGGRFMASSAPRPGMPAPTLDFTNVFDANDAEWNLRGSKRYTDTSGDKPLSRGKFSFELEATNEGGGFGPMPAGTVGNVATTAVDATGTFAFPQVTFDKSNVGKRYVYKLREVRGSEPGMTYDEHEWTITVEVSSEDVDGQSVVTIKTTDTREDADATVTDREPWFENTYKPASATATIHGTKTLTGRPLAAGESFTFELRQTAGPETLVSADGERRVVDSLSNGTGAFAFDELTFTKVGAYRFTVREVVPQDKAGGMTYDYHVCTVTVNVTNENGQLRAAASYSNGHDGSTSEAAFTNSYAATETKYYPGLVVSKTLNGRVMEAGEFSFAIEGAGDAEAIEGTTAASAEEANSLLAPDDASFSNTESRASGRALDMTKLEDVTFTSANAGKTYAYRISEVVPANANKAAGVTYDTTIHTLRVAVIDNLDGTLTVETYIGGTKIEDAAQRKVSFTNAYRAQDASVATADLELTKALEGRAWQSGDAFTFVLEPTGTNAAATPMPADAITPDNASTPQASVTVNGTAGTGEQPAIDFGTITYTKTGTYTYRVYEQGAGQTLAGITYTSNIYEFQVTVSDNTATGTLEARVTTLPGSGTKEFTNRYDSTVPSDRAVEPTFSKILEGRAWQDGDAFTFALTATGDNAEAAPMPERTEVTVNSADEATRISFGTFPISYDMVRDGGQTWTYEVREVVPPTPAAGISYDKYPATVTITAQDRGNGTIETGCVVENPRFTNRYESSLSYGAAGGLSLAKTITGRSEEAGAFQFSVSTSGEDRLRIVGTYDSPTLADGQQAIVATLGSDVTFTQDDAGKSWTYQVRETNPAADGYMLDAATRTVTISVADNPQTAKLTVTTTVQSEGGAAETFTYRTGETPERAARVAFNNSYTATSNEVAIEATKHLAGGLMNDGDFSFEVVYAADATNASATPVLAASNMGQQVSFGRLSYTTKSLAGLVEQGRATRSGNTWTIAYVAREKTTGLDARGITATKASYDFAVEVTDNGNGTMNARIVGDPSNTFENSYSAESATIKLVGTKRLFVPKGLTGPGNITDRFTFTLTPLGGAPAPSNVRVTNDANGDITFGPITFTLDDLTQALPPMDEPVAGDEQNTNVNEDTTSNPVEQEQNQSEQPKANEGATSMLPSGNGEGSGVAPAPAPETPNAPEDDASPQPEKLAPNESDGDTSLASDASIMPAPNASSGSSEAITTAAWRRGMASRFRRVSDADGVSTQARSRSHIFHYTVAETGGQVDGVTNDKTVHDIWIKVTDDGAGRLTAEQVNEDGTPHTGTAFSFTNTYDVVSERSSITDQLSVHKTLTGKALEDGQFTFELLEDGKVILTAKNGERGNVTFDALTYEWPGTHTYTIREQHAGEQIGGITYSDALYTVMTIVSDNGRGGLEVHHELAGATAAEFTNVYQPSPASLSVTASKVLKGAALADEQFTFRLSGNGIELKATNDANGQIVFEPLEFSEAGTYEYVISEVNDDQANVTYDDTTYHLTVSVVDKDGRLEAHAQFENDAMPAFANAYEPPSAPSRPTPNPPSTPKPSTKRIPQTGDVTEFTVPVALGIAGVAAIFAALIWKARKS